MKTFAHTRLITFVTLTLGYGCTYLTRNSLSYAAPLLLQDDKLQLTLPMIGVFATVFPIAYGSSNLFSGIFLSHVSPATLLATACIGSGLANSLFAASTQYSLLLLLWVCNGILQGFGAPACGRLLQAWFAPEESGTAWGIWACGQNLGGFIVPVAVGFLSKFYGWRVALLTIGLFVAAIGVLLPLLITDCPTDAGFLKPCEEPHAQLQNAISYTATASDSTINLWAFKEDAAAVMDNVRQPLVEEPNTDLSTLDNQQRNETGGLLMLSIPAVWLLSGMYFCVYILRQACTTWFIIYLTQEKGVEDVTDAALRVSGVELFGLAGSLLSGFLSDAIVQQCRHTVSIGLVGIRCWVSILFALWTAAALIAFWQVPSVAMLQFLAAGLVGFGLYGPQNMIALATAEVVPHDVVGAAQGLIGFVAYLGAANAGAPFAWLVQQYGWTAFFSAMLVSCGCLVVLSMPIINAKSYQQKRLLHGIPPPCTQIACLGNACYEGYDLAIVKDLWYPDVTHITEDLTVSTDFPSGSLLSRQWRAWKHRRAHHPSKLGGLTLTRH